MAKKAKVVASSDLNVTLLAAIGAGQVNYISKEDAMPLISNQPPLIEVNTAEDAIVDGKAPVRLTADGVSFVAANMQKVDNAPVEATNYAIITGAQLPASKRGGGAGAPVKYPFDKLEVGQSFFVPVTARYPDPAKSLGSAVSSANMKYSVETGETKTVSRTKRGEKNKALLDAAGNKIKETVTVAVRKPSRKFSIRPVKAGVAYGTWTAEADGALIARTL